MKAGKIILIVVLLLAVVGGGVFAYLWFLTDIFKSPKAMYDTYSESLKAEVNKFANKDVMKKFIDKVNSEEYTVKANVGLSVNSDTESIDLEDILSLEGSKDATGDNSQMKVTLNYSDTESFATDFVVNDSKLYGVFFDGVTTSYLGLNMDNLADWMEKLGADEETVNSVKDMMEKVEQFDTKYTLEKYEEYYEKYAKIVKENIPDSAYAKSDDKEDKSITLTLDSEILGNILDKVGKELSKDLEKMANEMGEEVAEEIDFSDFEEELNDAVEELKETDMSLIFKLEKPEDSKEVINITLKVQNRRMTAKVTVEENKLTIDIMGMVDIVVTKKEQGDKVTYTASLQLSETASSLMGSSADIEDYKFEIVESYSGLGTDTVEEEATITIAYGDYSFVINLDGTVEFGESDIETLTSSNTQFIDELSAEETEQLFEALGKRLVEVNQEKIEKSGIADKLGIPTSSSSGLLSNPLYDNYDLDDEDLDMENEDVNELMQNTLQSIEEQNQRIQDTQALVNSLSNY